MEPIGNRDMRFMQFMFKPTYSCNLACKYCHVHKNRDAGHGVITFELAKALFNWILQYCLTKGINRIDILWHGGEPLLTDHKLMLSILDYYNDIFKKKDIVCSSSIQTNLLLMTDNYVSIIKKYFNNTIGFSFDYNSKDRCYKNGADASSEIWQKALWVKKQGINVGAITQITKDNINSIKDLYLLFRNAEISFKYSRIRNTDNFSANLSDESFIEAIIQLFNLWIEDESQLITISNFREFIQMLITGNSLSCCYQKDCNILSFTPEGKIYFCDRSFNTGALGDYRKSSISDVELAIRRNIKNLDIQNPHCNHCRFNKVCNGGCLYNRINGWFSHECYATKSILEYIGNYLKSQGYEIIA